ncbi:HAD-IIB family hydrolase [Patescibacteria group bacterium]|nr:HAD-IIB family hydrolase [Patescibacteria group bacterium]
MIPRAIAFDLDGTLAESKQPITSDMAELLLQLMKPAQDRPIGSSEPRPDLAAASATVVGVLSGASWSQFQSQFLSAFPAGTDFSNLYLFPDNAAQCFIYRDGAWQESYTFAFSPAEVAQITAILINEVEETHFPQPTETWGKQIENRGAQISFSPLGQNAPLEAKKQWRAEHDAERAHLRDMLSEKLPDYSVRTGGETTIDITRQGITKGYGLQKLTELTGIPVSDMVYVGDALQEGGNDYVVMETGVQTHQVSGPQDTAVFIQQLIS